MSAPFEPGERALLVDARGRHYLVRLQPGGTFHTHGGAIAHDDVIGREEGNEVRSGGGMSFRCLRPRLADFVLKMPRGAQVVYPKDLGQILVWGDVFPGAAVLEAGTGSGALTIALCRAVGPQGRVVTYEQREDFQETARANVEAFFGKVPDGLDMRAGDVREVGRTGERFHRAVLDLPNPWEMLALLGDALERGGILTAYLPTTVQVQQLVLACSDAGFAPAETIETILRTWHVTERSVRPNHRMVAHTGFLVVARKIA